MTHLNYRNEIWLQNNQKHISLFSEEFLIENTNFSGEGTMQRRHLRLKLMPIGKLKFVLSQYYLDL